MKTRSAKPVLMMALLIGSPAYAETIKVYSLDPAARILSEATTESQAATTVRRAQTEPLSVKPVAKDAQWLKIERTNGGNGFVQKSDLKEIEIRKTFVIRHDASLNSSRLANTSDAKKPMDLILTGHKTTVVEKDASGQEKKITWHQVVANGKQGWVAGGALNVAKDKATDGSNLASKKPAVPPLKKDAIAPAATKTADGKPAKEKPENKAGAPEKVADAKPAASAKAAEKAAEKAAGAPAEKQPAALQTRPSAKTEAAIKSADAKPEQPNAKKPDAEECVRTEDEYKASERMQKTFGSNNPFVDWEGPAAFQSHMRMENKRLVLLAGPLGELKGHPAKTPIQICIDKSSVPYMLLNRSRFDINVSMQNITVGKGIEQNTYTRKAATGARAAR